MMIDMLFKKLGTRWYFAYRHSFRSNRGIGAFMFYWKIGKYIK